MELLEGLFSFPLKAKIGGTGVTKIFKEETVFLNFLSTDDSAFMWRGQEDFSVLCNMYHFKIRIYKEGSSEPTVIESSEELSSPINFPPGKIEDMLILHENGNHFSLIVPRDGFLATEGGLDFQRMEQSKLAIDTLEVDATKDVIIKE